MSKTIDPSAAARTLGRLGGSRATDAQKAAARANGARGGRPRTRHWYLHLLDGVADTKHGWPRYLYGTPVVITRDPGDQFSRVIELPGRTREEAWTAAQEMPTLHCTGCGAKAIGQGETAPPGWQYLNHADTYSGTVWHCPACAKVCNEDPNEDSNEDPGR